MTSSHFSKLSPFRFSGCGSQAMNLLYNLRDEKYSSQTNRRISPLRAWMCAHASSSLKKFNVLTEEGFDRPLLFEAETPQRQFVAYIDPGNKFALEDKLSQVGFAPVTSAQPETAPFPQLVCLPGRSDRPHVGHWIFETSWRFPNIPALLVLSLGIGKLIRNCTVLSAEGRDKETAYDKLPVLSSSC